MSVPPIKPTAIAVYVFRRAAGGNIEFLQIRRSASAQSHHQSWQTVYGGIEPGETAIQAALRELREETALVPEKMFQVEYLETFYFRPSDSLLLMPVFAVEVAGDVRIAAITSTTPSAGCPKCRSRRLSCSARSARRWLFYWACCAANRRRWTFSPSIRRGTETESFRGRGGPVLFTDR